MIIRFKRICFQLLLISVFTMLNFRSNAQADTNCLTKHQLLKMQSSSLENIRMFLINENWSFNGVISNQNFFLELNSSIDYFDYPVVYDIVSWEKETYYDVHYQSKIILYHSSTKPNVVIYQTNSPCFKNLLSKFSNTKGKSLIDNNKLVTIFKENDITFEFREYKNDNSSMKYSMLIYDTKAIFKEIQKLKEEAEAIKKKEEAIMKEAAEKKLKYDNILTEGDSLFSFNKFNEAKIKYLIALEIENTALVQQKINLCEDAMCNQLISRGDSLFNTKQYSVALNIYKEAVECSKGLKSLQEKLLASEKNILDAKITEIRGRADSYFLNKQFDLALNDYNDILQFDKYNVHATERIREIKQFKSFIENRISTIYAYKITNKNNLIQFQNSLLDDIKLRINKYQNGFVNLNYFISFDTLGNNQSVIKNISTSINGYKGDLKKILENNTLIPSSEQGYFLASQENLTLDIKWNTTKNLYKSSSKGIIQNGNSTVNYNTIKSFINNQPCKYGNYSIEVKNKEINGKTYSDINCIAYKAVGPEASLLSVLMPGWGTLKVTYGKQGWGRLTWFLITSGISIGAKLYSDAEYKKTLDSTYFQAYLHEENAKISNQISLITGGISAFIYLNDILGAFSKGVKTIKDSKPLRKRLRQGPVAIQNQSLVWK